MLWWFRLMILSGNMLDRYFWIGRFGLIFLFIGGYVVFEFLDFFGVNIFKIVCLFYGISLFLLIIICMLGYESSIV